ncbi:hypothetical protein BIW11_11677 [Tropilaelaps mercedesae]|uniref:Uncharacterized protein n=1 Tax=Tropilaelaps mercedesae TaxID=418985 RepID=A0A1V9XAG9_9ACAR|nr:hypothetical protein BIW11_11677 [Tropilaelaps mercedesae]
MQVHFVLVVLLLATAAFAQEIDTTTESMSDVTKGLLVCLKSTAKDAIDATCQSTKDFLKRLSPNENLEEAFDKIDGRFRELNASLNELFDEVMAERNACERRAQESLRPTFCNSRARTSYSFGTAKHVASFASDLIKTIINAKIKYNSENVFRNIYVFVRENVKQINSSLKAGVGCFFN